MLPPGKNRPIRRIQGLIDNCNVLRNVCDSRKDGGQKTDIRNTEDHEASENLREIRGNEKCVLPAWCHTTS